MLHERLKDPLLASLFMYLIYLADEKGEVHVPYKDIGKPFGLSKIQAFRKVAKIRERNACETVGGLITIRDIAYYRGFEKSSETLVKRQRNTLSKRKDPQKNEENLKTFEVWWNVYNKKRSRKKAFEKWCRLTAEQQKKCIDVASAYVESITDKKYQKDPLTYLNGECWNDEIITKKDEQEQKFTKDINRAAGILESIGAKYQ